MNYFEDLKNGNTAQWISYLNKQYMDLYAPTIKIFKLDKVETTIDNPYTEEKYSRIFLPYFEMKAFHLDNTWKQVLGEGTMPYLETQENLQFVVNFDDMVNKHRELKFKHSSDLFIEYNGNGTPSIENVSNNLILRIDGIISTIFNLENTNYKTLKKLVSAINLLQNFSATLKGENDLSINLISFGKTNFKNEKLNLFIEDITYKNITEILEKGDLILTHNYFLYEILSNKPGGDFGWDYATFILDANLRSLDKAQLPGDINKIIEKREYGLRNQIELE